MSYLLGADIGQINDYTAISVLRKQDDTFQLLHLERHLGESYTVIADRLVTLSQKLRHPEAVVDATGVGRAVVDLLEDRGLKRVRPVTITGGVDVTEASVNGRKEHRVPKRDLVGVLQVALQNGQLRIPATLELRNELVTELQNFKVKLNSETGHESFEHWRSSDHDDLVLSVALPLWYATALHPSWGMW